jgi:hypothetical protein
MDATVATGGRFNAHAAGLLRNAPLAWLFLAALGARLVVLYATDPYVANDSTGFRGPSFVPLSYRELAMSIFNWDFSHDLGTRSPGYPALVALCFRLYGVDNWAAIVAVQSLMAIAVFFAAYRLWSQLYGPGAAAVLATATAVLEPALILSESSILSEPLSVTLLMLSLPLLIDAGRQVSPAAAAASGLCVAWLALTRPAFQLLLPLFALYLALRLGARLRTRAGAAAMALLILAAGLPVAAWNAFNLARFGYFTPMTTQGFILTSHSAPIVSESPQRYPQYADVVEIMERHKRPEGMAVWLAYPEIMQRRDLSFAQASRLMQELSIEVFRDQPIAFAKSVYRAFMRFWDATMVAPKHWQSSVAFLLSAKLYQLLVGAGVLLYFAIAALDAARVRRWLEPAVLERLLILAIVGLVCLASTLPIAVENARYKLPLLPLMWGVVAASLTANWSRIRALAAGWR